jgi:hypothetical protein
VTAPPDAQAWCQALADTLLPPGVNAGRSVRFDCDDEGVAAAGAILGIPRAHATAALVACLHGEGLVHPERGVSPLACARVDDPPRYLLGLAVLVLAASRMEHDEQGSMAAYYRRLGVLLDIPLQSNWPQVRGVPELVGRFADLAKWMEGRERGHRGLLDLPGDVHPPVVGVPIHQSLLRVGDRRALGAFFERTSRLIDAGWDPVHQLVCWGGRHQLSAPLLALLERRDLHPALAGALRAARRVWDGSTVDASGRRVLPAQLTLHVAPGPLTLGATVPALDSPVDAVGGAALTLGPHTPAVVPLEWLAHAATGPLIVDAGTERVRLMPGPAILFEITPLGVQSVAAAVEDPVWVLTCEPSLIAACEQTGRVAAPLPAGWALLCDVEPDLLGDELRVSRDEERPLAGVRPIGGLCIAEEVWLLDHPPAIAADLPEPAPVTIDGDAHGDIEPGQILTLDRIAQRPGVHHVEVGEQELVIELAERGSRTGIGSLAFDGDPRRLSAGPGPAERIAATRICGPLIYPPPGRDPASGVIVRYRCTVDIIDTDGTVRNLGPPPPAAWLDHVGLPQDGPWEIADAYRVVWLCVDAPGRKFIVAHQAVDVPVNDDVLAIVDWYADAQRVIDRSDGTGAERWRRLVSALEAVS